MPHLPPSALVAGVFISPAPAARTVATSDASPPLPLSSPALAFLRLFLPPPALPDTACLLRRRLPLAGGSSASAPEPPSTSSAGSASTGDCLLLSGVGNTCTMAVGFPITATCQLSTATDNKAQTN